MILARTLRKSTTISTRCRYRTRRVTKGQREQRRTQGALCAHHNLLLAVFLQEGEEEEESLVAGADHVSLFMRFAQMGDGAQRAQLNVFTIRYRQRGNCADFQQKPSIL